jgi:hypothetical protein
LLVMVDLVYGWKGAADPATHVRHLSLAPGSVHVVQSEWHGSQPDVALGAKPAGQAARQRPLRWNGMLPAESQLRQLCSSYPSHVAHEPWQVAHD